MYVSTLKSIVCEWHQFQGLNVVIYRQYRQKFRALRRARGQLDFPLLPSPGTNCPELLRRTRRYAPPRGPVGARLVVPTHCDSRDRPPRHVCVLAESFRNS